MTDLKVHERIKRCYKRSTPVGRLRHNAKKITRHAELVLSRLNSWGNGNTDKRVVLSRLIVNEILEAASRLDKVMGLLEKAGFVPLKRSSSLQFKVGMHVAIDPKYLDKYRQVFASVLKNDRSWLKDLTVVAVLASGEIVIQRGKSTPFPMVKSHLVLLKSSHVSQKR